MVCHNCRIDCWRYGRDRYGHQRYRCNQCNRTFQDARERPLEGMYTDLDKAERILSMLVEGVGVRSIERLTDTHRDTILRLLVVAGKRCEEVMGRLIAKVPVRDVQLDELWGFCFKKQKQLRPGDDPSFGDAWTFVAVERTSKLVLN